MIEIDSLYFHNDENKPVRTHTVVTQARVEHYSDVVEYMLKSAIDRYVNKYKRQPDAASVQFCRKELTRYAVIRKDLTTANKIEINEKRILNEASHFSARTELHG